MQYEQSNILKQQDVRPKYRGYFDNVPETFIKNIAEGCLSQQKILSFFFYGNEHYTLNIKTTVTWHHDFYGCQGHKKKVITKRKN